MAQIKKFCKKYADKEMTQLSLVVFIVTDENKRDTYLVFEVNSKDETKNFKNKIIIDHLHMWYADNYNPTWQEIDDLITRIKKSGVLFF
jgi:hypothetical protein